MVNYKYENVYITEVRKEKVGLLLSFEDGEYTGLVEFMTVKNRKEFYSHYKEFIVEKMTNLYI